MSETALQIVARGPRADAEAAAAAIDADPALEGATYSILEEDEARGLWRIDAYPTSDAEADALLPRAGRLCRAQRDERAAGRRRLAEAWRCRACRRSGPGASSSMACMTLAGRPPNAVALRIEAGAAFGTGHHGTTVGCLEALDQLLKARRFARVLDVGDRDRRCSPSRRRRTGSRIVRGTDIDPVSVRIAGENARLNRARVRFVDANGLTHPAIAAGAPYDLVFANILARPLIRLARPNPPRARARRAA